MEESTLKPYYTLTAANGIVTCSVNKRITVSEFRDMLIDMKQKALEKNYTKLLANAVSVDFKDLTMSERHDIGLAAAEILKGDFKGVCVVQKQFINYHGENVANNRGADVLVIDNVEDAIAWLNK